MMRRNRTTARVATAGLCAAVLAACSGGGNGKLVSVETVKQSSAGRKVTADGNLQAGKRYTITPAINGKVASVGVTDGQKVEPGQTLFTIDDSVYRQQLDALDSASTSSSSSKSSGSSSATPKPEDIVKQTLAPATEAFTGLQKFYVGVLTGLAAQAGLPAPNPADPAAGATEWGACLMTLVLKPTNQAICDQILDVATQQATSASAYAQFASSIGATISGDFVIAGSNLAFAKALSGLGGGGGATASLDAQKAQLQAQIDQAKVVAPIGGTVVFTSTSASPLGGLGSLGGGSATLTQAVASTPGFIRTGSIVAAGGTVMTIYDTNAVQVEVDVDEADVPLVQVGQGASVNLDAFPDKQINGKVASISLNPTPKDSGGVAYAVNVDLPADQLPGWRPGMSATVEIGVESDVRGFELPAAAVVQRNGQDYVYVVKSGKAVRTNVTSRTGSSGFVIVTKGVQPGDVVVTSGASDLNDGDAVKTESPA